MPYQQRYTVRYRDRNSASIERCYYARDVHEARVLAMESIPYIRNHPMAIDLIRRESGHPFNRAA